MSGLVFTSPPLWRSCIQPDKMAPHHSPAHTACRPVASLVVLSRAWYLSGGSSYIQSLSG